MLTPIKTLASLLPAAYMAMASIGTAAHVGIRTDASKTARPRMT